MDSIALTYSLMGPFMAVIRPVTAFFTAVVAGIAENYLGKSYQESQAVTPDLTCPVDACCDGVNCDPAVHAHHHTFTEKLSAGFRFAFDELMADLAVWFTIGILIAGVISALVPDSFFSQHLGSGIWSYLAMLAASLPMYICATMSTPVAAALVLKGMSLGSALVLMMAGPATNVATLTVVYGLMGRRTLVIYLSSIVVCTLFFAFLTDTLFGDIAASGGTAALASASELFPLWMEWAAAAVLAGLMVRVVMKRGPVQLLKQAFGSAGENEEASHEEAPALESSHEAAQEPGGT